MFKKSAFTLAEVLITLGIIGVVAALTIPNLIAKNKEKEYITQFQKVYSELTQAYIKGSQDYGTSEDWTNAQEGYDALASNLKTTRICPLASPCTIPNYAVKTLNGAATYGSNAFSVHFILNGGAFVGVSSAIDTSSFGGQWVYIWPSDNNAKFVNISIDTNGAKLPNQLGYDVFLLSLSTKKKSPVVSCVPFWWAHQGSCQKSDNGGTAGWYRGGSCSYWMIKHKNMEYTHRDISSAEWWE